MTATNIITMLHEQRGQLYLVECHLKRLREILQETSVVLDELANIIAEKGVQEDDLS